MATASAKKSIDPDKLDTVSESYTSLTELTSELKDDPGSWVEDASKDKLSAVNNTLATGAEAGNELLKSLGKYLKDVGESFKQSELTIVEGIESNGSGAGAGSNDTGVYDSWLADPEAQREAAEAKKAAARKKAAVEVAKSAASGVSKSIGW